MRETDLYDPIKAFLQGQGYDVKGEVGETDMLACRGAEEPLIVELKVGFSLALFHQGIERQRVTDLVYLAVPLGQGRRWRKSLAENIALSRRLGLGLITVQLEDAFVEVHLDPGPYRPRKSSKTRARLLREFARRVGDPSPGGSTRTGLVTAYRQDAQRCAAWLAHHGPTKGSVVAAGAGVARATRMMADDHYGWFERVDTGIYALTPKGSTALETRPESALGGASCTGFAGRGAENAGESVDSARLSGCEMRSQGTARCANDFPAAFLVEYGASDKGTPASLFCSRTV